MMPGMMPHMGGYPPQPGYGMMPAPGMHGFPPAGYPPQPQAWQQPPPASAPVRAFGAAFDVKSSTAVFCRRVWESVLRAAAAGRRDQHLVAVAQPYVWCVCMGAYARACARAAGLAAACLHSGGGAPRGGPGGGSEPRSFHLGSGPFWLRFTYVTPVLITKLRIWKRPGR
jgi:hypothetical protein